MRDNGLSNLNILVTGGAGFIGSHIAETLLKKRAKFVRILDNLITGKMENINFLLDQYTNVEFVYGDISDIDVCRNAVKNIDVIAHQAALGSVPRSINDPLMSHKSNVNGFLNILIAAHEVGIKRVVYASSSSVYGDNQLLPKMEDNIGSVLSPYAATKMIDEIYAGVFTKCYKMECIGLRYFNIFGPRQDPNGVYAAVIPKFINMMIEGKQPIINGDGSYSRDFTYVDNAVQANILALTTDNKKCYGEVFNIGAGGRITLLELVQTINKELKSDIIPIFGSNRQGDIPHSNADIRKAKNMLKYNPKIKFEIGIRKIIDEHKIDKMDDRYINESFNIDYSKLLYRNIVDFDMREAKKYLTNEKILITGGCGSIGSEMVKYFLSLDIDNLIIIDNSECNYFYLKNEINRTNGKGNVRFYLGNINDQHLMENIFKKERPSIVIHMAAYKHVGILEDNWKESIKVNIIGCKIVSDLSLQYNVKKFIFLSTDKAVNPECIMGMCKRISEQYLEYLNTTQETTDFINVRLGNVLGTSGSLIPIFLDCLKKNINLQVNHMDASRYFLTISEAIQMTILSTYIGRRFDTLLLEMGNPIKIIDIAEKMIDMYDNKAVGIDIVDLKQGEKINENLVGNNEQPIKTEYNGIMKIERANDGYNENFIKCYYDLINEYENIKDDDIKIRLKGLVCD